MPQGDDQACEVEEAGVHGDASVIADHQATEVANPGEGALDFPSAPVPAQCSAVLKNRLPAFSRWRDQLNPSRCQLRAEGIAVVSLVADHPEDQPAQRTARTRRSHFDGVERFLDELDLCGRGRIKVGSHRNALAIDQNHPLCSLAPLGFSDAEAPFFAGAKLPSMKVSSHSSRWPSSSMPSSRCQARSSVPSSSHLRSRRQTVAGLPYCRGRSFHRAPERAIHKMPSRHCRLLVQGRPRRSQRYSGLGSRGSSVFHCVSVRSVAMSTMGHGRANRASFQRFSCGWFMKPLLAPSHEVEELVLIRQTD